MLTNFQTIRKSIDRLKSITAMQEDGSIHKYKKKEALMMEKELVKLERNLGGIKDMKGLPAALFVIDPKREKIAIEEAQRLGIPVDYIDLRFAGKAIVKPATDKGSQ